MKAEEYIDKLPDNL